MSNFMANFKSPWVLGGGALLGVVMLMTAKTAHSNGAVNDVTTGGGLPASVVGAYNIAGLQAVTQQAAIAADVGKAAISADATKQVAVLDAIKNANTNAAVVQNAQIAAASGVIQSQIQGQTATIIDIANNTNRLSLAQEQTQQVRISTNGQVQIAQQQAKAAKAASTNALIGKIFTGALSVAAAPFTGGASLMGLAGAFSGGPSTANLVNAGFVNTGPRAGDPIY